MHDDRLLAVEPEENSMIPGTILLIVAGRPQYRARVEAGPAGSRTVQRIGLAAALLLLGACSTLLPGADYPRVESVALARPETTRLGAEAAAGSAEHEGRSGFHILTAGVDGFLTRVQLIEAAEKSLDLQYFIFHGDETGRLITDALVRAADRGVRIRVLVDDGATVAGDEQLLALDAHPQIEIRVFNPFDYRGQNRLLRSLDFLLNISRLDYRMHNKLLVADNAVALIGGRNIGNQYFQMDPESQFADDDVVSVGPVAARLSATFDAFWNSGLAIPARALARPESHRGELSEHRSHGRRRAEMQPLASPGVDYVALLATGEPLAGLRSGRLPLVWAPAEVIFDSPDKKHVGSGQRAGRLMERSVAATASRVERELLMVTPYLIPARDELALLLALRARGVTVRILTNSLQGAPEASAQSGYMHYRIPLLEAGVELHEARSLLGNVRGSGQTVRISSFDHYALHAKLFIFDRRQVFLGSMNFDERSRHLNTEIGVIIDSPELAELTVRRFEAMVRPENAYTVRLRPRDGEINSRRPRLEWDTVEGGRAVVYDREPARSLKQRLEVGFLTLLPLEPEL